MAVAIAPGSVFSFANEDDAQRSDTTTRAIAQFREPIYRVFPPTTLNPSHQTRAAIPAQPLASRPFAYHDGGAHQKFSGRERRPGDGMIEQAGPHEGAGEHAETSPGHGDVTRLLHSASQGNGDALHQVLAMLHDRLRGMAHRQLAGEGVGHTLETDGLVHEAFLRLEGLDRIQWRDRQHLLAMAARTMRRVLIDYAEQRRTAKRGSGDVMLPLDSAEAMGVVDRHADELHALDEALSRLAALNPRQSQVVECRFFVGLSIEETADALALSPATVKRDWLAARAWLNRELGA